MSSPTRPEMSARFLASETQQRADIAELHARMDRLVDKCIANVTKWVAAITLSSLAVQISFCLYLANSLKQPSPMQIPVIQPATPAPPIIITLPAAPEHEKR